ncbi:MAG: hypothetical protein K8F91_02825 [Candidatus Obscuribacterales bacterium]|nr:hypothetical protein [Candidatus Obscuribacterales bacterium]
MATSVILEDRRESREINLDTTIETGCENKSSDKCENGVCELNWKPRRNEAA